MVRGGGGRASLSDKQIASTILDSLPENTCMVIRRVLCWPGVKEILQPRAYEKHFDLQSWTTKYFCANAHGKHGFENKWIYFYLYKPKKLRSCVIAHGDLCTFLQQQKYGSHLFALDTQDSSHPCDRFLPPSRWFTEMLKLFSRYGLWPKAPHAKCAWGTNTPWVLCAPALQSIRCVDATRTETMGYFLYVISSRWVKALNE